jgi:RNA polymerase sigma-70 factor (ECF subfamily)
LIDQEADWATDWAMIVRVHGPMAYATAWRIVGHAGDAEDAVQEAFLAALRLRRQRPVRSWGALLRHLSTRRALDLLRTRRTPARLEPEPMAPASSQPETVAVAAETADRLRQALARLSDREAQVFSLRYFGDLTNPQIAELLELAPGAVAVALHKARGRLQSFLQQPEKE